MKNLSFANCRVLAGVLLALFGSLALSPASPKDAAAKKSRNTLVLQKVPEVAIPQSIFNIPGQPSEGRNPFFPQSTLKPVPQPKQPNRENTFDTTSFVLNGITSPPKRTAMINGRTFEPGEEGEVRLPAGGKMLIKVEEIKTESATIIVGGVRHELRLRAGV